MVGLVKMHVVLAVHVVWVAVLMNQGHQSVQKQLEPVLSIVLIISFSTRQYIMGIREHINTGGS